MGIPSPSTADHATTAKAHPKAMKIGTQAMALSESMSPEEINELKLATLQHGLQLVINARYAMQRTMQAAWASKDSV